MKIAFVTREYKKRGGISRCVVELSQQFCQDNEVHIFANSWDESLQRNNIFFRKVPIISKPFFLSVASFAFMADRALRKDKFDLSIVPLGDGLKADIFVAHSCHRSWVELKKKVFVEKLKYRLNPLHRVILFLERRNLRPGNYRKIIGISQATKNELMRYYQVPNENIGVIYNGVNTNEFLSNNQQRELIRRELGIAETDIVILFVAHEFKRKGLKTLLEAVALPMQKAPVKLLVIGGDKKNYYQNLAGKLAISDKVYFLGTQTDIQRFYAASNIFVFPTRLEPFGLAITEAMASGLAVITSRAAGAAELIKDGETGLLLNNPSNPGELQDKIFKLVRDREYRDKLGLKAAHFIKNYSWDRVKNEYLRFYQKHFSS